MTPTPTQTHRQRIEAAMRWLPAAGWRPDLAGYDYSPLIERAMREYGMRRSRAMGLIVRAAWKLRGVTVREAGRPPSRLVLDTGDMLTIIKPDGVSITGNVTVTATDSATVGDWRITRRP